MPGKYNITIDVRDDDNAVNRSGNFTILVLNRPPTAALRVEGEVRKLPAGVSIMFTADDSSDTDGDIISYAWSFGDGGYGENVGVTHVFDETGIYVVELTVTDDAGGVDRGELEVRVVKNLDDGGNGDEGGDEGPLDLSPRVWFILIVAIIVVLIIVVTVILLKRPGKDNGNEDVEKAISHFYPGATASEEEELRKRDLELMDSYTKTIPGPDEGEGVAGGSLSSKPDTDLSGIDDTVEEDDPFHEEEEVELSFKSPDHYKKKRGEKRKKKDKTSRSRSGNGKINEDTSQAGKKGTSTPKGGKKLVLPELPKLDIKKAKVKTKSSKENLVAEDADSSRDDNNPSDDDKSSTGTDKDNAHD